MPEQWDGPVPVGVPAGYLYSEELLAVCDVIVELPIGDDEWAALKRSILAAWPRDPWHAANAEGASSGHAEKDDLSSEDIAP